MNTSDDTKGGEPAPHPERAAQPDTGARPAPAFTLRVRVRYGETDQMGVVHHAAYLHYLEDARTAWLRALGLPYSAIEARGIGLPVRRADLRYRAPARYEDELDVTVHLARMRGASATFAYTVVRSDGLALVDAEVELACIELASGRPRLLPDDLRGRLAAD
ncbi:MAG: thioesterase family protein [Planctomycetota bacterium]